jgi:hypothetical protein
MTFLIIIAILFIATFGFVVAFGAPYVPSLHKEVRSAFKDLYAVTSKDVIVDLGSGDGQVLLEATKRGATGYGYELNPLLVMISKLRLGKKASISLHDMWQVRLPETTTLVYLFIVTRDSKRMSRYLQTQVNERGRMLRVMTFGSGLKGFEPVKILKAHSLYEIWPESSAKSVSAKNTNS